MIKLLSSMVAIAMVFSIASVASARYSDSEIEVSNHDITVIVEADADATVDDVTQIVEAEKGGRASRISLTTGETWAEAFSDADVASTYIKADCHCSVDETEVRNHDVFVKSEADADARVDDVRQVVEAERGGSVRKVRATTGATDATSHANARVGYTNITITH